jgi:hypothetical protein
MSTPRAKIEQEVKIEKKKQARSNQLSVSYKKAVF